MNGSICKWLLPACTKNARSPERDPLSLFAKRSSTVKRPGFKANATPNDSRRGVAAVEVAIVAPLFLILIFGIIELGRAFMVQQIITNASREGARRAIIEHATTQEVIDLVSAYLGATSVNKGYTVSVSPNLNPSLGFGDPVTVSVSVPFGEVSWLATPMWLSGQQLSATSTMRVERPQ